MEGNKSKREKEQKSMKKKTYFSASVRILEETSRVDLYLPLQIFLWLYFYKELY